MKSKVIFAGCSFTAGSGWVHPLPAESLGIECKNFPDLWVNICHREISRIKELELVNIGQGGASNTEIFENSVQSISSYGHDIDIMFCQWTSVPRYNFNAGFEPWNTSESLHSTNLRKHDIHLNRGDHWPREYVKDLLDRLRVMHHLHWEILKIVRYTTIISNLCKKFEINVFFINGLCPWDENYFVPLPENCKPEDLTPFTKKEILNIESRNDEEIYQLYNLAHKHYTDAGGINPTQWLNLYSSMLSQKIDVNSDNIHPGKMSNQLYAEHFSLEFKNKIKSNPQF